MTLEELITALDAADPTLVLPHGFTNPHSYRGDYMDLAFEPASNVSVADMLADAQAALGTTYQGWKGGDFTMRGHTECWLAEEGCLGETIGALLLSLMLAAGIRDAARQAAGQPDACACGEPGEPGVIHRPDAPCYMDERPATAPAIGQPVAPTTDTLAEDLWAFVVESSDGGGLDIDDLIRVLEKHSVPCPDHLKET